MSAQVIPSAGDSTPGCALTRALDGYARGCAVLARLCMMLSVAGLVCLIIAVSYQIFGRHVLNRTPTWAESLRSEEHTSELQSLMRISYALLCLNKKTHPH